MARYPQQAATRLQVAIHEAAHFVAFEREGMSASRAEVHGTLFGRGGWSGKVLPWNEHPILTRYASPDDWLSHARVSLIGPMAEELLASGDAFSSVGEFVEARTLAGQAAISLHPRDFSRVLSDAIWLRTIEEAARIVERYKADIRWVASLLMKRNVLTSHDRGLPQFLTGIRRSTLGHVHLPDQAHTLVNRIHLANVPDYSRAPAEQDF